MDLRKQIMAIMRDETLTESEKAVKRQEVMSGMFSKPAPAANAPKADAGEGKASAIASASQGGGSGGSGGDDLLGDHLKCAICMDVCKRPVTAPCQHNFCLSCFQKWAGQGKKTCALCRHPFSREFLQNPRINTALVALIRIARSGGENSATAARSEAQRLELNNARPEEAFTTKNAKRKGLSNACSGKLMVTCPTDHFGPIGPEFDGTGKGMGLRVGQQWASRLECRQYGAHFPHVAGIAGQSERGAQSVVISGGYKDDEDHGEWFLYTGSGGRDLSGNKRTNNTQSFDQEFTSSNGALRTSCLEGLPLRVVRSAKAHAGNSYAPSKEASDSLGDLTTRYDGIYRVERCWRKPGQDGFLICRYLMVRCDNEPAPWIDDDHGDRPRPTPKLNPEHLEGALDVRERPTDGGKAPAWDWNEETERWGWKRAPPASGKVKTTKPKLTHAQKLMREFACGFVTKTKGADGKAKVHKHILVDPVSTPCGCVFCKGCLEGHFAGIGDERQTASGRSFRRRKVVKQCPTCKADITDCVSNMQTNHDMAAVIANLLKQVDPEELEQLQGTKPPNANGQNATNGAPQPNGNGNANGSSEAGAGPSASSPSPSPAADAAPARAPKKDAFSVKLAELEATFPGADVGLLETILRDQEGDLYDAKHILKRML